MTRICDPANLLETSHPDVEVSFRFHAWKVTFGALLELWMLSVPDIVKKFTLSGDDYVNQTLSLFCHRLAKPLFQTATTAATAPAPSVPTKVIFEPVKFLQFFSNERRLHIWTANPTSVFMFTSQAGFVETCEEWLFAALRSLGFPVRMEFLILSWMQIKHIRIDGGLEG